MQSRHAPWEPHTNWDEFCFIQHHIHCITKISHIKSKTLLKLSETRQKAILSCFGVFNNSYKNNGQLYESRNDLGILCCNVSCTTN